MEENRYIVLWIDDEPTENFMDLAFNNLIDINNCKDYESGIKWLKENSTRCDAVILDVNCLTDSNSSAPDAMSFYKEFDAIKELCKDPFIPWFVYTSGENYSGSESLRFRIATENDWDGMKYYNKPSDRDVLFENIKKSANNSRKTQIRHKFSEVFRLDDSLNDELIMILSHIEDKNTTDSSVFNDIRKTLDWIMKYMNRIRLLPVPFVQTNLTECGRFIAERDMQRYIPLYIQRHFASLTYICNDGSHRLGSTDIDTKNGKAPFLIYAVIYELMSVISWLTKVQLSQQDKDDIDTIYNGHPEYKPEGLGIIEEDKNNKVIHVGNIALPRIAAVDIGKKVRIQSTSNNKVQSISSIYPKYTNKYDIIDE